MIHTIRTVPEPVLREKSAPIVDPLTPEIRTLIADLKETCAAAGGIGLAAPQIGIARRVVVILLPDHPPYALINPEVTWASTSTSALDEGCLSIPNVIVRVARPTKVRIAAVGEDGKRIERKAEDLHAKVLQHEIDHLNGILITDYQ